MPDGSLPTRHLPAPNPGDHTAARFLDGVSLAFAPASYDPQAGEVDVVWSTGVAVRRYDWMAGEYYDEELDLAGANLARLQLGAPVLLDHTAAVQAMVGSVLPGSARVAAGAGIARIRFDRSSPEGQAAEAKVAGGHLRHVSVGYRVMTWEKVETAGQVRRWIARAWEPFEISLVPIPADAGAGTRAAAPSVNMETRMPAQTMPGDPEAPPPAMPANDAAARAERRRVQDIYARVRLAGLGMDLADELVESGASFEQVCARIVDAMAARQVTVPASPMGGGAPSDPGVIRDAMSEALAARLLDRAPTGAGERYRGYSTPEMMRDLLERSGTRTAGWAPAQIVDAAMTRGYHTTSDFPVILGNATNRALAELYKRAQSPIRANLCRERDASDFRDLTTARISGFPKLDEVNEAGEVKFGTLDESGEVYRVRTYARAIALSRQALVNDDLGAFAQAARAAATAAAEAEAAMLVSLLTAANGAGPTLKDGKTLFDTTRPTKASVAAAITQASVSAGRAAMRGQKDLGDGGPIGIGPKFILTGAELETDAERLVAEIAPGAAEDVNPFAGRLTPLVEARLSGRGWYLFADSADAPVFEVAYLNGQRMPTVQSFEESGRLGLTMRVVHDFGAGVIGWRGAWFNAGA